MQESQQLAPRQEPSPKPTFDAAGITDLGRKRERNEDAFLIATLQRALVIHDTNVPRAARGWLAGDSPGTLLVVADGMGGQGSGDVASQVAIETIVGYLLNVMPWMSTQRDRAGSLPGVADQLATALVAGDANVRREGTKPGIASHMGSTLTMAYMLWPTLYVAHVGDSRCYVVRAGRIRRLTTDHTLAQQMRDGGMDEMEVPSAWRDVLWNALGGDENAPVPQVVKFTLEPEDVIVLCSDGLTKHLTDDEILQVVNNCPTSGRACQLLVERANACGGSDNITVVVARRSGESHSNAEGFH